MATEDVPVLSTPPIASDAHGPGELGRSIGMAKSRTWIAMRRLRQALEVLGPSDVRSSRLARLERLFGWRPPAATPPATRPGSRSSSSTSTDSKAVNDSFGHSFGDRVLAEFAERIRGSVRGEDTVSRFGGDEFIVLLSQVTGAADAARVARKVLDALRLPFRLDGREVAIDASVGMAVLPDDGTSAEDLVRKACSGPSP